MSSFSIHNYFNFARVKLNKHTVHNELKGTIVAMVPDKRCRPLCHVCGEPGTVHTSGLRRTVQDLKLADHEVFIDVEYRKVWCTNCAKAKVEKLSFCGASERITYRLANYVWGLCKELSVESVAKRFNLNPKTVKQIDYEKLKEHFSDTDTSGLRIMAIDEIAVKKGHRYMTVVLNYETGAVVWMGKGRKLETLNGFLNQLTDSEKQGIEAVAMDMWRPYITAVKTHLPQAAIVFDFFHIVQGFNKVIDSVRRSEYHKASIEDKDVIKGSRYLLLKNKENLKCTDTRNEPEQLNALLKLNKTLNAVYILKDDLKRIYTQTNATEAIKVLINWCHRAKEIKHRAVDSFIKKLQTHASGILAHYRYPISTGKLEGVNNKIKLIKRIAYGFHDEEYFVLKVKQAFPGKKTA